MRGSSMDRPIEESHRASAGLGWLKSRACRPHLGGGRVKIGDLLEGTEPRCQPLVSMPLVEDRLVSLKACGDSDDRRGETTWCRPQPAPSRRAGGRSAGSGRRWVSAAPVRFAMQAKQSIGRQPAYERRHAQAPGQSQRHAQGGPAMARTGTILSN